MSLPDRVLVPDKSSFVTLTAVPLFGLSKGVPLTPIEKSSYGRGEVVIVEMSGTGQLVVCSNISSDDNEYIFLLPAKRRRHTPEKNKLIIGDASEMVILGSVAECINLRVWPF
jgi:hypothetical protein